MKNRAHCWPFRNGNGRTWMASGWSGRWMVNFVPRDSVLVNCRRNASFTISMILSLRRVLLRIEMKQLQLMMFDKGKARKGKKRPAAKRPVVSSQFVADISLKRDAVESFDRYPFCLPAFRAWE